MLLGQALTHKQTTYHVIMELYHGIVLWVDFFISNSISTGAPIISCFTRSQLVKKIYEVIGTRGEEPQ